jgi:hypothetical protein
MLNPNPRQVVGDDFRSLVHGRRVIAEMKKMVESNFP